MPQKHPLKKCTFSAHLPTESESIVCEHRRREQKNFEIFDLKPGKIPKICWKNVQTVLESQNAAKSPIKKCILSARIPTRKTSQFASAEGASWKIWGFSRLKLEKILKVSSKNVQTHLTMHGSQMQQDHPLKKCTFSALLPTESEFIVCERRRREEKNFEIFRR